MPTDVETNEDTLDQTQTETDEVSASTDPEDISEDPSETNSVSEDDNEPASLMDFVSKAVPDLELSDDGDDLLSETKTEETAKAGTDEQETDQTQDVSKDGKPAATDENPDDETDKEDGSLEITSKEFQRMNSKTRRKVRALQERAAQAEHYEVPARAAESLNSYLRENNIDNDSFNMMLSIGAALQKGDYKTFLEAITPFVSLAQQQLGIALAPDLAQQVQAGQITEDYALHVQRERLRLAQQNDELNRRVQTEAYTRQEHERSAHAQTASNIAATITSWENSVKAADPDYARKADAMKDISRALIAERGAPRTPQEAVALAQEAYERVNSFAKQFVPRPKPTGKVPSGVRANSGRAPEPNSLEEAIFQGLRAAQ